jgi:hypothetical protein
MKQLYGICYRSTSTSIFPEPLQVEHFLLLFFPVPLQDLQDCFSSTVTSFTIFYAFFANSNIEPT